jgi:metal-sulfur cluster biosynthetic enzyme
MNRGADVQTLTATAPFDYEGDSHFHAPVLGALKRVIDPEVALNIVDIGLVYGVRVDDATVHVRMTMTTQACPVADALLDDVFVELAAVFGDSRDVDVELVWEPPWSPVRLSDGARRSMGW